MMMLIRVNKKSIRQRINFPSVKPSLCMNQIFIALTMRRLLYKATNCHLAAVCCCTRSAVMDNTHFSKRSSTPSFSAIKKIGQKRVWGILAALALIAWILLLVFSPEATQTQEAPKESQHFVSPLNHVKESDIWIEKIQNGLAKQQKTTASLQQQLEQLTQAKQAADSTQQEQAQQVSNLQNQVKQLENQVAEKNNSSNAVKADYQSTVSQLPSSDGIPHNGISEDHLQLTPQPTQFLSSTNPKTPDTYVPAGTFAHAVMLGGADASAGVNTTANPSPVLLRILDEGTLPNHRQSHLQGCFATAAAVGDISSERGQMRLENLSCVNPQGQIVDFPVEGTVFGPEGKNGVRGVPLWREGSLLKRAFVAGALSGLSDGISQQYTTSQFTSSGTSTLVNSGDVFRYGAAQGASNAMDKIADYNIRRADQYHPVLQISAGTVVDIVFLKGFYLDGQAHDDSKSFAQATTNDTTSPPSTLPLTPQQIEMLKAQSIQQNPSA